MTYGTTTYGELLQYFISFVAIVFDVVFYTNLANSYNLAIIKVHISLHNYLIRPGIAIRISLHLSVGLLVHPKTSWIN